MSVLLVLGAVAATGFCLLVRKLPKPRAFFAAVAGFGFAFAAVGGFIQHFLMFLAHLAVHGESKVFGRLFAGSASTATNTVVVAGAMTIVVAFLACLWVHDMWPKHAAKMRTTIIGFAAPLLAVATGGAAAQVASSIYSSVSTAPVLHSPVVHTLVISRLGG